MACVASLTIRMWRVLRPHPKSDTVCEAGLMLSTTEDFIKHAAAVLTEDDRVDVLGALWFRAGLFLADKGKLGFEKKNATT